jgi:response regulator NasT
MDPIILAFPGEKNAAKCRQLLAASGYEVLAACSSCDQVLRRIAQLESGIIISGFRLPDGTVETLYESLPPGFSILLVASTAEQEIVQNRHIFRLPVPITRDGMVAAINLLGQFGRLNPRPRKKDEAEQQLITKAKEHLMQSMGVEEEQAHRLLQKRSMETGKRVGDIARAILSDYEDSDLSV